MDQDATGLSANFNIKYVYRITLRHGYATIKGFLSLLFCFFFSFLLHMYSFLLLQTFQRARTTWIPLLTWIQGPGSGLY